VISQRLRNRTTRTEAITTRRIHPIHAIHPLPSHLTPTPPTHRGRGREPLVQREVQPPVQGGHHATDVQFGVVWGGRAQPDVIAGGGEGPLGRVRLGAEELVVVCDLGDEVLVDLGVGGCWGGVLR
jgi:hypothetical protein